MRNIVREEIALAKQQELAAEPPKAERQEETDGPHQHCCSECEEARVTARLRELDRLADYERHIARLLAEHPNLTLRQIASLAGYRYMALRKMVQRLYEKLDVQNGRLEFYARYHVAALRREISD